MSLTGDGNDGLQLQQQKKQGDDDGDDDNDDKNNNNNIASSSSLETSSQQQRISSSNNRGTTAGGSSSARRNRHQNAAACGDAHQHIEFVDHFSLRHASSTVKFRGARVHVYDTISEQFILEHRHHYHDGNKNKNNNNNEDGKDDNDHEASAAAVDCDPLLAPAQQSQQQQQQQSSTNRHHHHNRMHHTRTTITVKRMAWASFGLRLLRLAYTLISILLTGYFFVLCFQIILFLFVNLPVVTGVTTTSDGVASLRDFIGILLSIPIFMYGMASLMAISTSFATDAWNGGSLLKSIMGLSSVITEVLYFSIFLVVPVLTLSISFMAGYENPWEVCCQAWAIGVFFLFCIFGLLVVWREVGACFELIATHYSEDTAEEEEEDEERSHRTHYWRLLLRHAGRAILLVQKQRYSGHRDARFLVSGDDEPPEKGYSFSEDIQPIQTKKGLYSRLTQLGCCKKCGFRKLDPPVRLYTTEEMRDLLPFVNAGNWSLEAMCCGNHQARVITTAKGPGALSSAQIKLSAVTNVVGAILMSILFIGILMWVQAGVPFYVIAAIICALCCVLPMVRNSRQIYYMYHDITKTNADEDDGAADGNDDDDDEEEAVGDAKNGEDPGDQQGEGEAKQSARRKKKNDATMFQLWETVRITQPEEWLCYVFIALELAFFYVWPCVSLFMNGNLRVGGVFIVVGVFSFVRRFFDPSGVLSELGCMTDIDIEEKQPSVHTSTNQQKSRGIFAPRSLTGPERSLVLKSRLSEIIGDVTRSQSVGRWMWVFGFLILLCLLLFLGALSTDDITPDERAPRPPIVLLDDFYYEGEADSLQYPACELSKGFRIPAVGNASSSNSMLFDYAMMSALAYESTNVTGYILPQWFGDGKCVDEAEFVSSWRIASNTSNNPIFFKLFSFPDFPDSGVVAIRGSETDWDWLVNMQLWSASGLVQMVKWISPYGWIWSPIMDDLVFLVSWVQSDALKKVSYYTVTTAFVNDLFDGVGGRESYGALRVTGASLGGGLAAITGAQTRAPAVAISGLGPGLGRHTWDPPVTMDQINKNVFVFIPDRDMIARIGGRPRNNQAAECTAATSNIMGCHSMWRSLCEIQYRCGSNGRPAICRCVQIFGYPLPIQNGTRTFDDACNEQEEAFQNATSV